MWYTVIITSINDRGVATTQTHHYTTEYEANVQAGYYARHGHLVTVETFD